ncbi:hypothetical protein KSP40_PGU017286 [Platanthera guangdongensis]|uniref:Uncharacterized protein n=1 Tax=Platanthera guangdongensis TaxID=2320717 RepID=A0ABR2LD92_9ASPA
MPIRRDRPLKKKLAPWRSTTTPAQHRTKSSIIVPPALPIFKKERDFGPSIKSFNCRSPSSHRPTLNSRFSFSARLNRLRLNSLPTPSVPLQSPNWPPPPSEVAANAMFEVVVRCRLHLKPPSKLCLKSPPKLPLKSPSSTTSV